MLSLSTISDNADTSLFDSYDQAQATIDDPYETQLPTISRNKNGCLDI